MLLTVKREENLLLKLIFLCTRVLMIKINLVCFEMLNFQALKMEKPRNQLFDIELKPICCKKFSVWPPVCFLRLSDVNLTSSYIFYSNFAFVAFTYTSAYQLRSPVHHT